MIVDLTQSPLIKTPLEGSKLNDLEQELAISAAAFGVKSPGGWQRTVEQEKKRYQALVDIFDPKGPLAPILTQTLAERMTWYPTNSVPPDQLLTIAQQDTVSILNNRRTDAAASVDQLNNPIWISEIGEQIIAGSIKPDTAPQRLSEAKLTEMRESLVGAAFGADGKPHKPEPAVHIHATASGHLLEHAALAKIFAKDSVGTKAFQNALRHHCPGEDPKTLEAFGDRWMKLRADRAELVVEAMQPTSDLVQSAIAESERRRLANTQPINRSEIVAADTAIPTSIIPHPETTARTTFLGWIKAHFFPKAENGHGAQLSR